MRADPIFVLWICGPPGAGKTTVAWEIWSELLGAGISTAYIDIDQLGMSSPPPADDAGRHRVKAQNLAAIVPSYRAAGARCVLVSGVVDVENARTFADQVPGARVMLCRLRLDHDELRTRLLARGWGPQWVGEAVDDAEGHDRRGTGDACVDTTGLPVTEVVRLVREQVGVWPFLPEADLSPTYVPDLIPTGPILWLCGATGVGKSTIGWHIFMQLRDAGVRVALIDLEQIGFLGPATAEDPHNRRLRARNLAAMWHTFQADGAQCLILVGQVDDHDHVRAYTEAVAKATVTLVRLHAGADQLAERIVRRGDGEGPRIPGDRLKGRPAAALQRIAAEAANDAAALARNGIGELWVDTDGLTADEVVQVMRKQIGNWPF